jgi:hypothetical protein
MCVAILYSNVYSVSLVESEQNTLAMVFPRQPSLGGKSVGESAFSNVNGVSVVNPKKSKPWFLHFVLC